MYCLSITLSPNILLLLTSKTQNIHRPGRIGRVEVDRMGRQISFIRVLPERHGRWYPGNGGDDGDLREPGASGAHPSLHMLPSKTLPPRESTPGRSNRPLCAGRHGSTN